MSVPPPPPRRRATPDASDAVSSSTSPLAPPPPPDPGARAARRAAEQAGAGRADGGGGRRRTIAIAVVVLVVLIVGAVVVITSGGGSSGPAFKKSTAVKLKAGKTSLERILGDFAPPAQFPTDIQNQILSSVGAYVDDAIVKPLRTGAAADTALASVFDSAAIGRLAAGDRAILVDEGLPKALGTIDVTTPPVAMSALVDLSGKLALVTATVDLKITAQAKQGIVKIERSGSLVFAPDASGAWKITGWTLHVDRTGPGVSLPTTTTTAPAVDTTVVTT